jgi:hypothetical protein
MLATPVVAAMPKTDLPIKPEFKHVDPLDQDLGMLRIINSSETPLPMPNFYSLYETVVWDDKGTHYETRRDDLNHIFSFSEKLYPRNVCQDIWQCPITYPSQLRIISPVFAEYGEYDLTRPMFTQCERYPISTLNYDIALRNFITEEYLQERWRSKT